MNSGDTAFMLIATAMVMLMTPGLALFYGGLVRRKNVLATTMQSFIALGLISIVWVVYGYSLAFGPDVGHFIGNLDYAWLKNVGLEPGPYSETIPDLLFCAFQLMFAIITPALITGAFAERMKFRPFSPLPCCGQPVSICRFVTGCGARADGWGPWAPLILPAVRLFISIQGRRPWWRRWFLASVRGMAVTPCIPIICR